MRFGWGTAASAVLHGDRLYIVNDNEEHSFLMALDKYTGDVVWTIDRDEKSNWATPFVWQNAIRTEIVTVGTGGVRSYDLDGKLLWSLQGMSSITIATPFAADGLLYISSGYVMDPMKPIYAIRPGASGDITLAEEQTSNNWIAWSDKSAAPYNPSTLVYRDRLYVLYDRGLFQCFDARTGMAAYDKQRLPEGRAFTSSPWACDDKIFCLSEDGETFVIKAGDQFEILHTNRLEADDMCMATPALAGNRLLIRTSARLYCIAR
jgi:outer membrane protein assembly factor BamB